ncbi:MAG: hypothetical protein HQL50_00150 [Magnetococcales bacterium]|nr:hypothetical protein [Magnetococcales bacterium]
MSMLSDLGPFHMILQSGGVRNGLSVSAGQKSGWRSPGQDVQMQTDRRKNEQDEFSHILDEALRKT